MSSQDKGMSRDDYQTLQKALDELECITNMDEVIVNLNAGVKAFAVIQDPDSLGEESWGDQIFDEQRLFTVLHIFSSLLMKNQHNLDLPEMNELSPQEEADIKRWRAIERVVELKGDKKALEHHRKNLKSMFEAERIAMKGDKDLIRGIEKTWKALDSELEADIIFADSLIPKDL